MSILLAIFIWFYIVLTVFVGTACIVVGTCFDDDDVHEKRPVIFIRAIIFLLAAFFAYNYLGT